MIKVLAIGDVVGRPGRRILEHALPRLREKYAPDVLLVNGENAAGGFGITPKIYNYFVDELGVDCITTGNHWHDKKEILDFVETAPRLVLPANMNNVRDETLGLKILPFKNKPGRFAVINLLGRAFMHGDNRSPFDAVARLLAKIPTDVKVRIIDVHAEATSEKQAIGHFTGGQVSLVYGTHSHVPTIDLRIIKEHTGYVSDLGATGAYDSIIGMNKDVALKRLLTGQKQRLEPAEADPWLCAVAASIDPTNGQCLKIERIIWKGDELKCDFTMERTQQDRLDMV